MLPTKSFLKVLFCLLSFFYFSKEMHAQQKCLDSVKTGKFSYSHGDEEVIIKRTKKRQIEKYSNGKKLISKIKWVSENELVLTFVKAIDAEGCLQKGDKLYVLITNCTGSSYTAFIKNESCGEGSATISIL